MTLYYIFKNGDNNSLTTHMLMHGASEVKLLCDLCLREAILYNYWSEVEIMDWMVRDDLELPDDGGEISKSQGRGWRFEPRL